MKLFRSLVLATFVLSNLSIASAEVVELIFMRDTAGNGSTSVNVTHGFSEVATPIYTGFNTGTELGQTWGGTGLNIGGSAVTFTNSAMSDYGGITTGGAARFIGDQNGMGMRNSADYSANSERPWMIDGQESFTWNADKDLYFAGVGFRPGFGAFLGQKELSVSSPDWIGLAGVSPGSGITFESGTGTFKITNASGSVALDNAVTVNELVGASGPQLDFSAASGISFANTGIGAEEEDLALTSVSLGALAVPEPSSASILLLGLLYPTWRRRR
ncbi:MAG: hypothetical protein AAF483_08220 [Planctomycetota bacterium]